MVRLSECPNCGNVVIGPDPIPNKSFDELVGETPTVKEMRSKVDKLTHEVHEIPWIRGTKSEFWTFQDQLGRMAKRVSDLEKKPEVDAAPSGWRIMGMKCQGNHDTVYVVAEDAEKRVERETREKIADFVNGWLKGEAICRGVLPFEPRQLLCDRIRRGDY